MKTIHSSHLIGNTRFQGIRALWTIAMIIWITVAANPSFGQTVTEKPHTVSYQGTLMKSGAPVTSGAYKITVTLYSDEAGTQSVWSDEYNTEVKDGLFNILLGSAKTLPSGIDLDQLYLGVKINGTSELRPLTQIASATTSISVADNSITKDKLATDYIAGISINGKKVTGKGSVLNIKDGVGMNLQYDEKTHSLSLNSLAGLGKTKPTDGLGGGTITPTTCNTNDDGSLGTNQVSGGCGNTIWGTATTAGNRNIDFSTISGGQGNTITNQVAGGQQNPDGEGTHWHTIGGGRNNSIKVDINAATENITMGAITIGGGEGNTNAGPWGVIGGGQSNVISNAIPTVDDDMGDVMTWDVIAGGNSNTITAASSESSIGGGVGNRIATSNQATIGGGDRNFISTSDNSTITGGQVNLIQGSGTHHSVIGGDSNCISGNSEHAAILSGGWNQINLRTSGTTDNTFSTIAGGSYNFIESRHSFIGAGWQNHIKGGTAQDQSVIAGGSTNTTNAFSTAITGGNNNNTDSYGQTVCGYFNDVTVPTGASKFTTINNPNQTNSDNFNDKLFMVGNGKSGTPHNAFEVSYNGHSTVFDKNGSGSTRASIEGSTYRDNVIYAWGNVTPRYPPVFPYVYGTPLTAGTDYQDFGVASIVQTGVGTYDVFLNIKDATGSAISLSTGAVALTLINAPCNRWITCTRFTTVGSQTKFTITITKFPLTGENPFNCDNVDNDFSFIVTGRK